MKAVVIWGSQLLLEQHSALNAAPNAPVILIESKGLSRRFKFHKQKILFVLTAMREYAKRRGWIVATAVEEFGSGVRERPKREELIRAARRREIDLVLVWRLGYCGDAHDSRALARGCLF